MFHLLLALLSPVAHAASTEGAYLSRNVHFGPDYCDGYYCDLRVDLGIPKITSFSFCQEPWTEGRKPNHVERDFETLGSFQGQPATLVWQRLQTGMMTTLNSLDGKKLASDYRRTDGSPYFISFAMMDPQSRLEKNSVMNAYWVRDLEMHMPNSTYSESWSQWVPTSEARWMVDAMDYYCTKIDPQSAWRDKNKFRR